MTIEIDLTPEQEIAFRKMIEDASWSPDCGECTSNAKAAIGEKVRRAIGLPPLEWNFNLDSGEPK